MILKLLILSLLTTSALSQTSMLIGTLTVIDNICTCNFVIFNPNGLNNLTAVGNPSPNCTFEDAQQAIGMGTSTNIPTSICSQLPNIEKLVMENVGIKHLNGLPLRNCVKLRTLKLGQNQIEAVPANVFSFTVLERIDLNDNDLTSFDEHAFDSLYNLRTLNINGNPKLTTLPGRTFSHVPSMQNLLASRCGLRTLDSSWFGNFRDLIVLDLSWNNFTSIPQNAFNSQTNLRFLDLSRGELATVPEGLFLNNRNLLILHLQSNRLTSLPDNLFVNLPILQNLDLSGNVNLNLTSSIFRPLSLLRILDISSTNLTSIDGLFSSMPNLVSINLSNNRILSIPDNTFSTPKALETINLARNSIKQLDSRSFGSLHNLSTLDVHNNLIDEVDNHFMEQATMLSNVDFTGNNCTQMRADDFGDFRDEYMNEMRVCFDKFDLHAIEITTFNSTNYSWYTIRSGDGWDALRVTVTAFENVNIALSESSSSAVPSIEIQIGQNRNRESNILHNGVNVFGDGTRNRLNEASPRSFIIGWRFGVVMVFRDGDQFPFMVYKLDKIFPVNFFGLRTVINDGDFDAVWNVSRIYRSSTRALRDGYDDIEVR